MSVSPRHIVSLGLLFAVALSGCNKSEPSNNVSDADQDLMTELLGDIDLTEGRPAPEVATEPLRTASNIPADNLVVSTVSSSVVQPDVDLSLKLKFGDTFSLVKTVQQTLNQKSAAFPAVASTSLELHMDLSVQQLRDDASLLRISYTRVRYEHDINGERQLYDSAMAAANGVPAGLEMYSGMVKNGFSFWLANDNTIRELVGYNAFLQRCVATLPVQQQAAILAGISDRFGRDGVAGFVDDCIGILPYDARSGVSSHVSIGDIWTRQRTVMMPVPVEIKSTCRLESMSPTSATIQVTGVLTPSRTSQSDSPIDIQSGRTMGTCVVDRTTGMPVHVTRDTFVSMAVTTAGGETLAQEKQIRTTIESARPSQQDRSVVSVPQSPPQNLGIQRASVQTVPRARMQVSPIPTTPQTGGQTVPLSSTATAVY